MPRPAAPARRRASSPGRAAGCLGTIPTSAGHVTSVSRIGLCPSPCAFITLRTNTTILAISATVCDTDFGSTTNGWTEIASKYGFASAR